MCDGDLRRPEDSVTAGVGTLPVIGKGSNSRPHAVIMTVLYLIFREARFLIMTSWEHGHRERATFRWTYITIGRHRLQQLVD